MARPRKQDAIDIPAKAIRTAVELMRRKGGTNFSLAELAKEIGCSAPALYNHFTSKDDLLLQVRETAYRESLAQKKQRYGRSDGDPLARLRDGGIAYLDFARDNPALYRLLYCPPADLVPPGTEDVIPVDALSALTNGVSACQAKGYAKGLDAEALAFTLWSAAHGSALLALDQAVRNQKDPWENARRSIQVLIDFIRNV